MKKYLKEKFPNLSKFKEWELQEQVVTLLFWMFSFIGIVMALLVE